ncbi:MAG: hypothetical protein SGPRY_002520 [Prymnesium sp.]
MNRGEWFAWTVQAILENTLFEVQPRRFYVAVTLAEAETLRALMHGRSYGSPIEGSNASFALRHGGKVIDCSANFTQGFEFQNTTAWQVCRSVCLAFRAPALTGHG